VAEGTTVIVSESVHGGVLLGDTAFVERLAVLLENEAYLKEMAKKA
jgi:hypothetical protein